jgi:hypothetical protein
VDGAPIITHPFDRTLIIRKKAVDKPSLPIQGAAAFLLYTVIILEKPRGALRWQKKPNNNYTDVQSCSDKMGFCRAFSNLASLTVLYGEVV